MASSSASTTSRPHESCTSAKMIFAPAGTNSGPRADQYTRGTLSVSHLSSNPLTLFNNWFRSAQTEIPLVHQPETVCLSTAALPSGIPSSRFVYLKELDERGFVIYSNWGTSRKARDLESNPQASLAFWWREVERQVRIEGEAERLSWEESSVYFGVRARGSKVGAWASEQSTVLKGDLEADSNGRGSKAENDRFDMRAAEKGDGRAALDKRVSDVEERFKDLGDDEIKCPEFWGGLRIVPKVVEFWQGRESRLHDRFRYTLVDDEEGGTKWKIDRLSP